VEKFSKRISVKPMGWKGLKGLTVGG